MGDSIASEQQSRDSFSQGKGQNENEHQNTFHGPKTREEKNAVVTFSGDSEQTALIHDTDGKKPDHFELQHIVVDEGIDKVRCIMLRGG